MTTPSSQNRRNAGPPRGLTRETLRQWRSDVDDFVTAIRNRLQSVSQSITSLENKQQTIAQETSSPSNPPEIFAQNPTNATSRSGFLDRETNPAEQLHVPLADSAQINNEGDPAEKLNAIKLQLAKQLENK
jgi:hypothetical protein